MPIMPMGKHKGEDISAVPSDYLKWLSGQDWPKDWLRGIVTTELDRRSGRVSSKPSSPDPVNPPQRPMAARKGDNLDLMMKEQHAFTFELELVRDNRAMLEDIINRGERDRLANGQGVETVKRLCTAIKRVMGIEKLDLAEG